MSENKFIKRLKGEQTAKSVLEIKNESAKTSFANMPEGTSNANDVYSDHRGNATGVLKGTENWKLDGQNLVETTTVYGDGRDFTDSFSVFGNGLWVDATCTFATARRFSPNTKFVLKLCGHDLETVINHTIDFTLIVKFGTSNFISKTFTVTEQAFNFCKEFAIDFAESNSSTIKVDAGSTMQIQLLCADPAAQAVLYNGMTVFTALQRRVDGDAVASDKKTFDEVVQDIDDINEELDDLEEYVDDTFVRLDGTSIMTAPLKFEAGSMRGAVGPYLNGVSFWKMDAQGAITNYANFTDSQFWPVTTNAIDLGRSANKWKNLYLAGKMYVATINNGGDLTVPVNTTGTLATKADVDLAANSGRMITNTGVWYAKMYAATVAPSAENGTNYADFSQVDGQGNPIIVIYERQNGAWVQSETITPPAEYDGYVPITSKIWDIAEQAGQQGGRILWNHQSKEFTPYPQIISFDGQNITNSTFSGGTITNSTFSGTATLSGASTVNMPQDPTGDQIVNKDYVDNHIPKGIFDLFDWKWADHEISDMSWLRADTFSWQSGSVYKEAYKHLRNDMYNWYSWENNGTTIYTKKAYPEVGEKVYSDSALTTEVGEITEVTDTLDITVEKITVNSVVYDSVSGSNIAPTTETVGGITVQYIPAEDGHKIVTDFHESEVADVYTATGVAWYYIIDYGSKRFKLPRTQFGVTGLRDTVGKYVAPGLPNITGAITQGDCGAGTYNAARSGAFRAINAGSNRSYMFDRLNATNNIGDIGFNAGWSNSIYGNGTTVQPPATQQYLYFYVGQFSQSAVEQTAGLNASLFNNKVDIGHQVIAFQAPNAGNNYTWYRKYADGWVEQGGVFTATVSSGNSNNTCNFPITMKDTHYAASIGGGFINNVAFMKWDITGKSTTYMSVAGDTGSSGHSGYTTNECSWQVSGMAA